MRNDHVRFSQIDRKRVRFCTPNLDERVAEVPSHVATILAGDLNVHVGDKRDVAVMMASPLAHQTLMVSVSISARTRTTSPSWATRYENVNLVSVHSGRTRMQIDFFLLRNRDQRLLTQAKAVPMERWTHNTERCSTLWRLHHRFWAGRAVRSIKYKVVATEGEWSSCHFLHSVSYGHDL